MPGSKTPPPFAPRNRVIDPSEATRGRARACSDVMLEPHGWRRNRNVDSTAELSPLAGLNESRGTLFALRRVSLPDLRGANPVQAHNHAVKRRWPQNRVPICGKTLSLSVLQVSLLP